MLLLLLLLGMNSTNSGNSSNPRGRRMVAVRGRTLTRIAPDTAVITVAITVHAGTLVERVQMLRRGRYPLLLLLMVLLNLPDKVTAVATLTLAAVPQVNLVGVVVEETLLLLLKLLLLLASAL